ncbi:acyl-CoA synthetase (AMP-forming)/AMP-acid ligase II [Rhodococcus sp. OK519]|uniref:class I adenylate-forming enzyme family protein n=1 Tax=Rhodococcus sp. OK519 TaxID=2135729 RepID=UPI000D34B742|nr:acyl-CoA synthetase (AMP-forming)/AMP-acid ligase II [Rhodococcus sp. OK519]
MSKGLFHSALVPGGFAAGPERYRDISISEALRGWAEQIPEGPAFITATRALTWRDYDRTADTISGALAAGPGGSRSRVAVVLPDTGTFHAALVGCYRAGRIAAAIGPRSGVREIAHVMRRSGCAVLVTASTMRGRSWRRLLDELREHDVVPAGVVVVHEETGAVERPGVAAEAAPDGPDGQPFTTSEVTILNSTSGTTGLPKVVAHNERKWVEFAREAMQGAHITADDVVCSVVPAPFGFGLWSAHFLPALLGIPVVVTAKFDVDEMAMMIERERVTVLCCVSTQFKMLLRSEAVRDRDLSSLRVLYTGGEPVPYRDARAFEERTGAKVLQFYGSNEAGVVSRTTLDDDVETRLRTCGHVLESANVRVLDDAGSDCAGPRRRGQPAVRGPLLSAGYWEDSAANLELYTDDGWMLLGDVVEIDETGRVRVVGRKADFVIRGGKNISIVEIEELVGGHESVSDVAVVGVPDDLYGERVCAVVVLVGGGSLDTELLATWLRSRGVTTEYLPEYVVPVDGLALGPGGKTDRRAVRATAVEVLSRTTR